MMMLNMLILEPWIMKKTMTMICLGYYRSFVRNKPKMKGAGITHVLNVAEGNTFYHVNLSADFYKDTNITYKGIKASDSHTFSFKPFLQEICDFIEEAVEAGGTVVVNCREGVSRSSTCVIAFLMLKRSLHVTDALKTVLDKRKICPNDNFLRELIEIEQNRKNYFK